MASPFFTVLIPTFNRAWLLPEAVKSVLAQSFEDYEIVIVNDRSTDNTEEVVRSFKDPRIRHVVNDRSKGLSGARNAGIFQSRGEWVAFLDDDDHWLPHKLEAVCALLQKEGPEVGLVYTGHATYDFDKKKEIEVIVPEKEGWMQKDLLYNNWIGTPSTVAVRADILKKIGGCDEDLPYYEDNDLYVRVSGLAKVRAVKEALTLVRVANSDRLSFRYEKRVAGYLRFMSKHKGLLDGSPRLKHRIASLVFMYAWMGKLPRAAAKALPWTLAGVVFDMPNFLRMWKAIWLHRRAS